MMSRSGSSGSAGLMWRAVVGLLAMIELCAGRASAQVNPYYNIVSVETEQISNAVRVKVEADGAISASVERWWSSGSVDGNYYLDWGLVRKQTTNTWPPECYPKVDVIRVHLANARPRIGNVVGINRYPVSHVKLVTTPEPGGEFGLDLEIVLYKGMRLRQFTLGSSSMWDAYWYDHHDPACFEITQSPDRRSLIFTVASDRLPDEPKRLKIADIPEAERKLKVELRDGFLYVSAQNAALSALIEAVGKATGKNMVVEPAAERVVTLELPGVSLAEFVDCVATGYGLIVGKAADRLVFCDPSGTSTESQAFVSNERVPVRYIRAAQAVNLLPSFLLRYLRVDGGSNALMVSGSERIVEKVRQDVAKIDQPATQVSVEAVVVESLSASDLISELGLTYSNDDVRVVTDTALGDLTYSTLGTPKPELDAKLQALVAAQKSKTIATSSILVTSGETGEIFVGEDRYVTFRRSVWDEAVSAEPVSAGVKLSVTPRAGSRVVTMTVTAEAKEVGELDAVTHLPVVNTRSAKGTFEVVPGQTIVIGGLNQRQASRTVRKVPILGDLPILGALFRKTIRSTSEPRLLVLLTPRIVPSETESRTALALRDGVANR